MRATFPSPHVLVIAGLVAMVAGALDPLEGSLLILPGIGFVSLGALLRHSRVRASLYWSFALVAVGVAALWGLSAFGGIGARSGNSWWWGLLLVPYPIGWVMGIVGGIRHLREGPVPATAT